MPRLNKPTSKLTVPGNSADFMEAVFRPEIFPMISGWFLPESTGSWQESTGKNSDNFRSKYCFHAPAVSGVFLQDLMARIIHLVVVRITLNERRISKEKNVFDKNRL
jgi:hypothetical protein